MGFASSSNSFLNLCRQQFTDPPTVLRVHPTLCLHISRHSLHNFHLLLLYLFFFFRLPSLHTSVSLGGNLILYPTTSGLDAFFPSFLAVHHVPCRHFFFVSSTSYFVQSPPFLWTNPPSSFFLSVLAALRPRDDKSWCTLHFFLPEALCFRSSSPLAPLRLYGPLPIASSIRHHCQSISLTSSSVSTCEQSQL